jgi:hypothetical protein
MIQSDAGQRLLKYTNTGSQAKVFHRTVQNFSHLFIQHVVFRVGHSEEAELNSARGLRPIPKRKHGR